MPSLTRKSPSDESGFESDSSEASVASSPGPQIRTVSKRVRLNDGSASPVPDSQQQPELSKPVSSPPTSAEDGPESDEDEFKPGSIVRVKLGNFVTYTEAEFNPGPSLNMVIGPNGTGKSTLVCAICLGLGFSTAHLGRQKDIADFIKHGADEAIVEIELAKNPARQRYNTVIRRHITKNNKSTWFLNDKKVTLARIQECTASYSIQVDNLCQFLPQDKVAEFAAMNSVQLLESTQLAVAGPAMAEQHTTLKELGKERREKRKSLKDDQRNLTSLEQQQAAIQRDVDRLHERKKIMKHVERLELARPIFHYHESRRNHLQAREKFKAAKDELDKLEQLVSPALQECEVKEKYRDAARKAVGQAKRQVERREIDATELRGTLDKKAKDVLGASTELDAYKERQAKIRKNIATYEKKVANMQRQLDNSEEPSFDAAAYNERIRAEERKVQASEDDAREIRTQIDELSKKGKQAQMNSQRFTTQLDNLSSQIGKQGIVLQRLSNESAKAWEWIQEHQDDFQQRIFGPPAVECSVSDLAFAPQVESLLNRLDFCTFTCQNTADFKKLHSILHEDLKLAEIVLREVRRPLSSFPRPVSDDELERLGFDGWAIDYLQGPDEVLSMLCEQNRLHLAAVSQNEPSQDQHDQIENSRLSIWVTKKSKYTITRRQEYGASQTRVDQFNPPSVWTNQVVDSTAAHRCREEIEKSDREFEEYRSQAEAKNMRLSEVKVNRAAATEKGKELKDEKDALQKAVVQYRKLPHLIEQDQETLDRERRSLKELRTEREETLQKQETIQLEKAEAAVAYAASIGPLRQAHEDLYIAELTALEAAADTDMLKDRHKSVHERLEHCAQVAKEAGEEKTAAKEQSLKYKVETQAVMRAARLAGDQETVEFLSRDWENATIRSLEEDIEAEKARLELTDSDDPQLLRQYDRRNEEIASLGQKIERQTEELSALQESVEELRAEWEPQLDSLVAQISTAFSRCFEDIGCAGQVSVEKNDDDFAAWAIIIHVKFRENEELTRLTAQRQSGGERAVSTIFYLMSLQKLTRSPFRVVDEINQGMDQRNERVVHEQMVDIACDGDTSQYFLITPKLLTGLKYHPKMKVHVIASGEYMPQDPQELSFKKAIDIAIRRKKAAAAS